MGDASEPSPFREVPVGRSLMWRPGARAYAPFGLIFHQGWGLSEWWGRAAGFAVMLTLLLLPLPARRSWRLGILFVALGGGLVGTVAMGAAQPWWILLMLGAMFRLVGESLSNDTRLGRALNRPITVASDSRWGRALNRRIEFGTETGRDDAERGR